MLLLPIRGMVRVYEKGFHTVHTLKTRVAARVARSCKSALSHSSSFFSVFFLLLVDPVCLFTLRSVFMTFLPLFSAKRLQRQSSSFFFPNINVLSRACSSFLASTTSIDLAQRLRIRCSKSMAPLVNLCAMLVHNIW